MYKARLFFIVLFLCTQFPVYSDTVETADHGSVKPHPIKQNSWMQRAHHHLQKIWHEGNNDLYLTGYAWHNRYLYSPERLAIGHYNEHAWGGGFGKGFYDEDGDWQSLYAIAFLDSHTNVEPWAGYAFLKTKHFKKEFSLGAGFTVALTMRPDIFNGYPFPAATPLVNATYKRLSLFAAYVPGHKDIGNILFIFARWSFGN